MASLYQMMEAKAGRRPASLYECRDVELPEPEVEPEAKPAEKPKRASKAKTEGDDK